MARIVLIDQQPIALAGTEFILRQVGHDVVGSANNGLDGLELSRTILPDLIITDLDIPKLGGLDVIKRIVARKNSVRVLVLTAEPADVYEHLCFAAGAAGFISKLEIPKVFLDAVSKVLAGKSYFDAQALRPRGDSGELDSPDDSLTPREITVLHYLADGYRVKQIANELAISDRTVSTYKTRLLEKTGAQSLVELIRVATQRGILKDDKVIPVASSEVMNNQFNNLLNQLPFPICFRAPDARVLAANQAYFDFLDVKPEQLLDSRLDGLNIIDEEHRAHIRQAFNVAVNAKIPYMMVTALRIRGERKVLRHSGVPVLDDAGELIGMLCSSLDLGEEQQQIQLLQEKVNFFMSVQNRRRAYLLLHEEEQERFIQVIEEKIQGQPKQVDTVAISATLERMKESIHLVADLIRLEAGDIAPAPFFESLNELTEAALQALPNGVIPEWTLQHHSAPLLGWIDPVRYTALIKALLLHIKHTGVKKVDISTSAFEENPGLLDWTLQLKALPIARVEEPPIVYMALAKELAKLLRGEVEVVESPHHVIAKVVLYIPIAAPS